MTYTSCVATVSQRAELCDARFRRAQRRGQPVDWIASLDVPLMEIDGRTNFQIFQRIYLDGGDDAVALKSGSIGVSAFVSAKLAGVWEPQLLWIQTFGGGGSLVRPRLKWTGIKNTTFSLGVDIFTGANDGYFGRYNERDRVYGEVRVAF